MENTSNNHKNGNNANTVLAAGLPFDVEVEWTEQKNDNAPLGEVTFPFEQKKKGTLHFDEDVLHHPLFYGQPIEIMVQRAIEANVLKEGVVDSIRIDSYNVAVS